MDRFLAMRIFYRVVETGSLARAGRELNISPPAVTRAIAGLEEAIGTRLLIRTTRKLTLTESGQRYIEDCRRILMDLEEAEAAAAGAFSRPTGTLTVSASVLFGKSRMTRLSAARAAAVRPCVSCEIPYLYSAVAASADRGYFTTTSEYTESASAVRCSDA